jgi:hypothetical protein
MQKRTADVPDPNNGLRLSLLENISLSLRKVQGQADGSSKWLIDGVEYDPKRQILTTLVDEVRNQKKLKSQGSLSPCC